MTPTFQDCSDEGQVAQHRGSERRGPARLRGRCHRKWELGAHRETLVSITNGLWAGPARLHHTELHGGTYSSPAVTLEIVEILISVFCWTDRKISLCKGTGEICPYTGKVTNPNVSLPYRERSLNGMTGKKVMNGPGGENEWRPALPDGTGISICLHNKVALGPRTKWKLRVGGAVEWAVAF